eukprot:TRINITY_DN1642_c0_g1_i10.p1 TRINITY_DN1642_c0_g1~~TRINITY_DN1642_c0_g1_i10.p1  ORF type:complete len:476 (-),score=112.15 TRINITY_DN1642_c0_g1_i10:1080-2306(-)
MMDNQGSLRTTITHPLSSSPLLSVPTAFHNVLTQHMNSSLAKIDPRSRKPGPLYLATKSEAIGQSSSHTPYDDQPTTPPAHKGKNGKDYYYCKHCETTWPLTFFRNRQQFGAHCSNCSRQRRSHDPSVQMAGTYAPGRRARDDSSSSCSDSDDANKVQPDRSPPRPRKVRKTKRVDSSEDLLEPSWDFTTRPRLPSLPTTTTEHMLAHTPSSTPILSRHVPIRSPPRDPAPITSITADDELVRLLNVVNVELVGMNELETLKMEIARLRREIVKRDEAKCEVINSTLADVVDSLGSLRSQLSSEMARYEQAEVREAERTREQIMYEVQRGDSGLVAERLEEMCDTVSDEARRVENAVVGGVAECQVQVQYKLERLCQFIQQDSKQLSVRFNALEEALRTRPTPSNKAR